MNRTITIIDPASGEKRSLEIEFSDAETTQIKNFATYTRDLTACKYFEEKQQASLNIKGDKNIGISIRPYTPPVEVCDSFLLRLRPFVLRNEGTFFLKIHSLIGKRVKDPLVHKLLRAQRDLWQGKHFRSMIKISDNFGVLNSDSSVMDYLNAFEYHRDPKKRIRLEFTRQFFGDQGLRALFLLLLADKAKAIMTIGAMCEYFLGIREVLNLRTEGPVKNGS